MQIDGFISFNKDPSNAYKSIQLSENQIRWSNGFFTVSPQSFSPQSDYFKFLIGAFNSDNDLFVLKNTSIFENDVRNLYTQKFISSLGEKFALGAIYSEKDKLLLLSRDLYSAVPVYYIFIAEVLFAFSTDLASLLRLINEKVPLSVSSNRISDYSTFGRDNIRPYDSGTFFNEIKVLLPGHVLSVIASKIVESKNVSFNTNQYQNIQSLEDYSLQFRNHFIESIEAVCPDDSLNLGAHLSGGLDSSSIASTVHYLHSSRSIHTFYYDVDHLNNNDAIYSSEVAKSIGSFHHIVKPSLKDFEVLSRFTKLYGQPEHTLLAPSLLESLLKCAREVNCNVILSGHGGDNVVGNGLEIIEKLFNNRRWQEIEPFLKTLINYASIAREYETWHTLTDEKKYNLLLQRLMFKRVSSTLKHLTLKQGISLIRDVTSQFPISYSYFAKAGIKSLFNRINITQNKINSTLLRDDLKFNNIDENKSLSKILHGDLPDDYLQWFDDVFVRQSMVYREQMFALGNYFDVSNRFPFFSKKLFEICMCIPLEIKFGNGTGRAHFRESMKNILLEKVRTRHDKGQIGTYGRESTLRLADQSKEFIFDNKDLWEYYNKNKYIETVKFLKRENQPSYLYNRAQFQITHAISLAIWLNWIKNKEFLINK
jgi:asparagine synthase (glutamine-hydrolysing)